MTTTLTETAVSKLEPGKTIRDHRFKGLMAIGRKGYTTYAYQTDLRRNGRFVRTVRVTLGRSTDMTIKEARIAAAKAQEKIRSGVDPNAEATSAKELTLLSAVRDHIEERDFAGRVVELPTMWRALWTTSLLTAARRASLLAMRREDVDVENGTITLAHVKTMKQGATLPIGERLADTLYRYLQEPSASEWLWPGRVDGRPMANLRLRGFPYASHRLRHNWTTLATAAGVPFMEQRMLMTHAFPGIGQVYTDPNALVEHLRQHSQAVEDLVAQEAPTLFG